MTTKIKNDRGRYTKRADISPGAPSKLSGSHLKADAKRAKLTLEKLRPLNRAFIYL